MDDSLFTASCFFFLLHLRELRVSARDRGGGARFGRLCKKYAVPQLFKLKSCTVIRRCACDRKYKHVDVYKKKRKGNAMKSTLRTASVKLHLDTQKSLGKLGHFFHLHRKITEWAKREKKQRVKIAHCHL